jgi:hypothetical protein
MYSSIGIDAVSIAYDLASTSIYEKDESRGIFIPRPKKVQSKADFYKKEHIKPPSKKKKRGKNLSPRNIGVRASTCNRHFNNK